MSSMITASGQSYHFTGYKACTEQGRPVLLEDIAHHLAQLNRFGGAAKRPYSVAEHSLLVSELAQRDGRSALVQLAALMHDAHEAYTVDLTGPAKEAVNLRAVQSGGSRAWSQFEREHEEMVHRKFGLKTLFSAHRLLLKDYDNVALATERRDLIRLPADFEPWDSLRDGRPDAILPATWLSLDTPEREARRWSEWRDAFEVRFYEIAKAIREEQAL